MPADLTANDGTPSGNSFTSRLAHFATSKAMLVVAAWIAFAAVVNVFVPQLDKVAAQSSTPPLPVEAPSMAAFAKMDKEFGSGRSRDFVVVVVERRASKLTSADREWVIDLTKRLDTDTKHISFVPDVAHKPKLLDASTSKDGRALYIQVGLPGETGSPKSLKQVDIVRAAARVDRPSGLNASVTGTPATITDVSVQVEHSIHRITIATVALIAILLLLIYRSVATTALIVMVIGVCLATTRGVAAWLGLHVLDLSPIAGSFMTAVVMGASTDYTIFLVSRYHEYRRSGLSSGEAATAAATKVSAVVIGSAGTVIVAIGTMAFAKLGAFATTGPVVAINVGVTLLICLTLTPAVIRLAGARGWIEPRPLRADNGWSRLADQVATRPGRVLVAGMVPLVLLAIFYPMLQPGYDPREVQPASTESNVGYAALGRHFPVNEILPDWLLVTADHDMRTPADLAALEQMAQQVSRTSDVISVRGLTRPLGEPIEQATLAFQANAVGKGLNDAVKQAKGSSNGGLTDGLGKLSDGATKISDGAGLAYSGGEQLADGAKALSAGLNQLSSATAKAHDGSVQLREGAQQLADGLTQAANQSGQLVDALELASAGLSKSVGCSLDVVCQKARQGIDQIASIARDELITGLKTAASGARQLAAGTASLSDGLAKIDEGMKQAKTGSKKLADGQTSLANGLGQLSGATSQFADGADRAGAGIGADTEKSLDGLVQAADHLRVLGKVANGPGAGFYLPPEALKTKKFATLSRLFLSEDGHTARFAVLGKEDAFKKEAMTRSHELVTAANSGLKGTTLQGATVAATGIPAINADLEDYSAHDFRLLAFSALLAVLLILMVLLRSLVGPILLLLSVVLSYAAAVGLAVLTWQVLLGDSVDSVVPVSAFILLVAVGADYNMLLMMRILEESPDGSREGVGRALRMTGGVITAAGIIFAGSMLAMMAGSVESLRQMGFTVGIGLLLDTFVVRSLVVPALASLLGRGIWWPRLRLPQSD